MEFRSVDDLNRDIARWSESLPEDVDLIVGIPRSGMLAATLLALHLHKPLADLDGILAGRVLSGGKRLEATDGSLDDRVATARRILVVDDSTNRGGAIRAAKEKLADRPDLTERILWGAPYVAPGAAGGVVDTWYEKVPQPRAFEWNVLHHSGLVNACMVLEGVLRADRPQDADTDPARLVPGAEIGWVVTARPEEERSTTERWLKEQGIRYRELVMAPGPVPPGGTAAFKADVYARTKAWLLVEEDATEAERVAQMSGRPVYCVGRRAMAYPGVSLGQPPRRQQALLWRLGEFARIQRLRLTSASQRVTGLVGGGRALERVGSN